jgi:hypothetical protein
VVRLITHKGNNNVKKFTFLIAMLLFSYAAQSADCKFERVRLGGVVDHNQIYHHALSHDFKELTDSNGNLNFRTTPCTAQANGMLEVTTCLHIRSGDSSAHSRLFNKFVTQIFTPGTTMAPIFRADTASSPSYPPPLPTTNVTLDREALWESNSGDPILKMDASGCWNDAFEVTQGNDYQMRVMVLCGQTLHCEVSYGSTLTQRFWPN